MKTALTILLMSFCLAAQGQIMADTVQYKTYSNSTGTYLIKYEYDPNFAEIPATYPPGKAHYDAVVTVLELIGGDTTQIYQPLRGVFVAGECACYHPEKIIIRYKELQKAEQ